MLGELDPFDFTLAALLGMTREQMLRSVSNDEYLQWRAYHNHQAAQQDLAVKKAERNDGP
jgi:hypothetical protein